MKHVYFTMSSVLFLFAAAGDGDSLNEYSDEILTQ